MYSMKEYNQNIQDYLKTILKIQIDNHIKKVNVSEIAKKLNVSVPAVTDKIKLLVSLKLVVNYPYKGVSLTKKGKESALRMIRHHRLWEIFLTKELDIPSDKVHEEAEKLEHACSDYLIEIIDKKLGYPKFDPHGQPIYPSLNT